MFLIESNALAETQYFSPRPERADVGKATERFNNGLLNVVISVPVVLPKTWGIRFRKARQSRPKLLTKGSAYAQLT